MGQEILVHIHQKIVPFTERNASLRFQPGPRMKSAAPSMLQSKFKVLCSDGAKMRKAQFQLKGGQILFDPDVCILKSDLESKG